MELTHNKVLCLWQWWLQVPTQCCSVGSLSPYSLTHISFCFSWMTSCYCLLPARMEVLKSSSIVFGLDFRHVQSDSMMFTPFTFLGPFFPIDIVSRLWEATSNFYLLCICLCLYFTIERCTLLYFTCNAIYFVSSCWNLKCFSFLVLFDCCQKESINVEWNPILEICLYGEITW